MRRDIKRLATEWIEHDKIVLAVDYDDTIFPWKHSSQKDCEEVIDLIKWCQTIGAYVMIHTASDPKRYDEIREYCKSKGLKIDSINENPIILPFGNLGKPYYNWQLCDRSGLKYAKKVLLKAAKLVTTHKRRQETLQGLG